MADSKLQKSPLAFLPLFELKTLGDSPTAFGDTVAPVSDVTDLYMLDRLTQLRSSGTAAAPGAIVETNIVLTSRQYLHLRGVSGAVFVDAADVALDVVFQLMLFDPGLQRFHLGVWGSGSVHTQSTTQRGVGVTPPPMWIPPGWSFRLRAELVGVPTQPWDYSLNVLGELITD